MTVGEELSRARQKLGLSLDDISARTNVSVRRLAAIEAGDVDNLPALIYLKGFLRAYADEVGLDPDDIAERYVSEFEGPAVVSTETQPFEVRIAPLPADSLTAFDSEEDGQLALSPSRRSDPSPSGSMFVYDAEPVTAHRKSSVGASQRSHGRFAPLLIVSALALLGGYLVSANADRIRSSLPRASASSRPSTASDSGPARQQEDRATPTAESESPPARASAVRETATPEPAVNLPPSSSREDASARVSEPPTRARTERTAQTAPPAEARIPEATIIVPGSTTEPAADVAAREEEPSGTGELTGSWSLTTRVESSSLESFKELTLGYRLQLEQRGHHISGAGFKLTENGHSIPSTAQTPIAVDGTIDGNRLALNFTEHGTRRTSAGNLVLFLTDDGSLRGRFKSDAAQSSGSSIATRESSARD